MRKGLLSSVLFIIGLSFALIAAQGTKQSALANNDPRRQMTIIVDVTETEWWLVRWEDNSLACDLYIDHNLQPAPNEIYQQCGSDILDEWYESDTCVKSELSEDEVCKGFYLYEAGSVQKQKEIVVELPVPRSWIELNGCETDQDKKYCKEIPSLLITAEEPLPNEVISRIQGTLNEFPFICKGNSCEVKLRPTGNNGVPIEFWADSSYGDSTTHYQGRIRVAEFIEEESEVSYWQVDIISDQDDFNNIGGCAQIWESFPPLGSPPNWLANPYYPFSLETDEPYTYLAGQLITQGHVDASECDDFGLSRSGFATQCGMEKARYAVRVWQNLFNVNIIRTAQKSGIPSQLIKLIFALESQFWPATREGTYLEYGFGHINELGADTLLLWNHGFYSQFCPLVLEDVICNQGYSQLDEWNQILLRGALLAEMELEVPYSRNRIDPDQAQASVDLVAETLLGNCAQINRMVYNETDLNAGDMSSYEDLWKFTLVNYHSGPGCLSEAIREVLKEDQDLDWENVSQALELICPDAIKYVDGIIN